MRGDEKLYRYFCFEKGIWINQLKTGDNLYTEGIIDF